MIIARAHRPVWVRDCRSLAVSEWQLLKVNQPLTGSPGLSVYGRNAKLCITAMNCLSRLAALRQGI